MANILFVRYGNFQWISEELMEQGHKCYYLMFELGDIIRHGYTEKTYVPAKIKNNKFYPISDEELYELQIYQVAYMEQIKNTKPNKKLFDMYRRYMYFIDNYLDDKGIDLVCVYNGSSWIEQLILYFCKKKSIRTLFFEEGYFRPYTVTCDPTGINYDSSIPKEREFYEEVLVDRTKYENYLDYPENDELLKLKSQGETKKIIHKLLGIIGTNLGLQPKVYIHNSFLDYVRIFMDKKVKRNKEYDNVELPDKFIFAPFQVHSDTQILFHSPHLRNMEEYVDTIVKSVKKLNTKNRENYNVVFKEHPKDITRISYDKLIKKYECDDNVIFIKQYDTKRLIQKAQLIITINSTVGIEALMHYKKVITLGNAFYNIDGIVKHCNDLTYLFKYIEDSLSTEVNRSLVDKFLYYLRFEYMTEGSWKCRNTITIENIIEEINKLIL